jgi:hypothetical protein
MSLLNGLFPIATDNEGRTIPGAFLYSYDVGTNTPKDTYSDSTLLVPNANPLEADGSGWFPNVYLGSGGYKLVLRDADDIVIKTQDNYYQAADATDIANLQASIATVSQEVSQNYAVYTDTGAADAYVLATTGKPVEPTAYVAGMVIEFKPANANTGASTVNVNSLGLRNLYDESGNALASGFLETSAYYQFIYESSNFRFLRKGGLVDSGYIAADAVITTKIASKNVTLAKIADGTANKIIAHDSSGVVNEITNPMRLLASGSITAVANLDFVLSTLQTSQAVTNSYLIKLIGFQPASDDVVLWMTLSSDGGSTWAATNYRGAVTGLDDSNAVVSNVVAGGTELEILGGSGATEGMSNASNEIGAVDIYLYNVNTGTSLVPIINWRGGFYTANSEVCSASGTGSRSTAADYDAVRISWEGSGNFAAVGSYYIYAIPNVA